MRTDVTQRVGDAAIGVALAALGVWGTWVAVRTGMGTAAEPGPGLFPAAICVLLTLGGAACAVRAWWDGKTGPVRPWIDGMALRVLALVVLLCAAFVPLGMPLAGFVFVVAMARTVGQVAWGRAAAIGAFTVLVFWLIFDRLLSVQLPYGLWWSA